ncbi:MAG: hypothetical protein WBH31_05415 [Promethearchaeia archaeon]
MPKCPYCQAEVNIEDFYEVLTKTTKKGEIKKKIGDFKGQFHKDPGLGWGTNKMWVCPHCDTILGFSDHRYKD